MDRRRFLRNAGLTTLGSALLVRESLSETLPSLASEARAPKASSKTLPLPTTSFTATVNNPSGIPLGGIGAGSIEIRPDGYFADWLIFNMGAWSPEQPSTESGPAPEMGPEGLQFFLRCAQDGKVPQLRRLGIREDQNDLYSLAFAKSVKGIVFDGKFPFATLEYLDDSLPVQVTGIAFAPIIPGDARTSATPGFTLVFKVKNHSDHPVTASLLGTLQNPLAVGAKDRGLRNEVIQPGDATTISLTTESTEGRKSVHGSLAFSVTGGKTSFVAGSYREYLGNGNWGGGHGFGAAHYSYLHTYYRDGKLPNLNKPTASDDLLIGVGDAQIDAMDLNELQELRTKFEQDAFFHEFIHRVELIEPGQLTTQKGLANLMKEFRDRLNHFSGDKRENSTWGDCALESSIHLASGEEKEVRFVLSWFFPNHFSSLGPNLGHQYEHWFQNALDVNRFLVAHHSEHRAKTIDFAETMLSTSVEKAVAFSWAAQLSTLIKSSWWCKDGRFAIWEGLGCCGLHTTDITYQGSFPIIALFPELQMQQVKMGATYQRADGRIPHFFSPDLLHVDNGFDRVDMNPQYVMMVCRDYLWTGDKQYAKDNWSHVLRAIRNTQKLDGDGDGIPDRDTRRNTYDQWDLEGSPAYICSLWLGSLRAGIRLAEDLGETAQAEEWKALHGKAQESFVKRLWNGEYFNLWVSENGVDECCMSDQLSGEWYTGMMGLEHSVTSEKIKATLSAVYKHNFNAETGLLNATYPEGRKKHFRTHQNLQAAGNWTGIEYANAALMIEMGFVEEGLNVIRSVHDRYVRSGRRWNHVECGDHYFRAMSSWTSLLALTGLRLDVPNHTLTVEPKLGNIMAPWFVPGAYGLLVSNVYNLSLDCRSGSLHLEVLKLQKGGASLKVFQGRKAVPCQVNVDNNLATVKFDQPLVLEAGSSLSFKWS
jgi:uncharacterized protein (DUF608 family)